MVILVFYFLIVYTIVYLVYWSVNSYNEVGRRKSKFVGKAGTEMAFVNTTTYSYFKRF